MRNSLKSAILASAVALTLAMPSVQAEERAGKDQFLDMVLVKGDTVKGNFKYNSNVFRDGITITIPDYYIGKYEVSQELYTRVMQDSPLKLNATPYHFQGKGLPAECMTWYDAVYFCNRLSEMSKLNPTYTMKDIVVEKGHIVKATVAVDVSRNGYRLPTELEWEYAARGGDEMEKDLYAGSNTANDVAWTAANSTGKAHPIGTKKPNEIGIYDMSGNVWEYTYSPYGLAKDSTVAKFHIIKGGGWWNYVNYASVSANFIWQNDEGDCDLGFRVVRNAK